MNDLSTQLSTVGVPNFKTKHMVYVKIGLVTN